MVTESSIGVSVFSDDAALFISSSSPTREDTELQPWTASSVPTGNLTGCSTSSRQSMRDYNGVSVCRGRGLGDPAPLWGDDPLRLSGPTELERETQQESAGAEPPQRHLLRHQQTCSESGARTLRV